MKKWIIVALVLVAVAVAGGYYLYEIKAAREALMECEVSVKSAELKEVGFTSAKLELTFSVRNKGDHKATLDSIEYSVYGDNHFLGNGSTAQRVDIPVGSARDVVTDFDLLYTGAAKVIWSAIQDYQVSWRIPGTAFVEFLGTEIQVPFEVVVE